MSEFQVPPEETAKVDNGVLFKQLKGTEAYLHFEDLLDDRIRVLLAEAISSEDPLKCFSACREVSGYLTMRCMADGAIGKAELAADRIREAYETAQREAVPGPQGLKERLARVRRQESGFGRPANPYGSDPKLRG